jgi:hypothetical protein
MCNSSQRVPLRFKPTTPMMMRKMDTNLMVDAVSLNKNMPISATIMVPTPDHTAYTMLISIRLITRFINPSPIPYSPNMNRVGNNRLNPLDNFMAVVPATSKLMAINSKSQSSSMVRRFVLGRREGQIYRNNHVISRKSQGAPN